MIVVLHALALCIIAPVFTISFRQNKSIVHIRCFCFVTTAIFVLSTDRQLGIYNKNLVSLIPFFESTNNV